MALNCQVIFFLVDYFIMKRNYSLAFFLYPSNTIGKKLKIVAQNTADINTYRPDFWSLEHNYSSSILRSEKFEILATPMISTGIMIPSSKVHQSASNRKIFEPLSSIDIMKVRGNLVFYVSWEDSKLQKPGLYRN